MTRTLRLYISCTFLLSLSFCLEEVYIYINKKSPEKIYITKDGEIECECDYGIIKGKKSEIRYGYDKIFPLSKQAKRVLEENKEDKFQVALERYPIEIEDLKTVKKLIRMKLADETRIGGAQYEIIFKKVGRQEYIIDDFKQKEIKIDKSKGVCQFVDDCKKCKKIINNNTSARKITFINKLKSDISVEIYSKDKYNVGIEGMDAVKIPAGKKGTLSIYDCKWKELKYNYKSGNMRCPEFYSVSSNEITISQECVQSLVPVSLDGIPGNKIIEYYFMGQLEKHKENGDTFLFENPSEVRNLKINDSYYTINTQNNTLIKNDKPIVLIIDFNKFMKSDINNKMKNQKKSNKFLLFIQSLLEDTNNSKVHLYKYINYYPTTADKMDLYGIDIIYYDGYSDIIDKKHIKKFKAWESNNVSNTDSKYKKEFYSVAPIHSFSDNHITNQTSEDYAGLLRKKSIDLIIDNIKDHTKEYSEVYYITYTDFQSSKRVAQLNDAGIKHLKFDSDKDEIIKLIN